MILAGISVFEVGRHTVGLGKYADDADTSKIGAIRVSTDGEAVNVQLGPFHEDDYKATEQAARSCLADSGHPLRRLDTKSNESRTAKAPPRRAAARRLRTAEL